MREIKFRAWDSFTSKMIGNHEPLLWNKIMPSISIQDDCEYQSFMVMQFTGLKDNNGVDIYEGDIVSAYGVGHFIKAVEFNNGMFLLGSKTLYCYMHGGVEIIGNIHQNPELIK